MNPLRFKTIREDPDDRKMRNIVPWPMLKKEWISRLGIFFLSFLSKNQTALRELEAFTNFPFLSHSSCDPLEKCYPSACDPLER